MHSIQALVTGLAKNATTKDKCLIIFHYWACELLGHNCPLKKHEITRLLASITDKQERLKYHHYLKIFYDMVDRLEQLGIEELQLNSDIANLRTFRLLDHAGAKVADACCGALYNMGLDEDKQQQVATILTEALNNNCWIIGKFKPYSDGYVEYQEKSHANKDDQFLIATLQERINNRLTKIGSTIAKAKESMSDENFVIAPFVEALEGIEESLLKTPI